MKISYYIISLSSIEIDSWDLYVALTEGMPVVVIDGRT